MSRRSPVLRSSIADFASRAQTGMGEVLRGLWDSLKDDLFFIVFATVWAMIRAMGATVQSGENGLKFSFGRATKVLEPGFHPLLPFLQIVKRVPTRSRTLDLPQQRVVNSEGLVYHVDANLVYRVVDIRKALIQIDDLVKGMNQMLGLGVQEVLRETTRVSIQETRELNASLARNLARRLEPWGVEVERAGFVNVAPSAQTLRITQFGQVTRQRLHSLSVFEGGELDGRASIGLLGSRARFHTRGKGLRSVEFHRRRAQQMRRELLRRGWSTDAVRAAERSLLPGGGIAENSLEARSAKADKGGGSSTSARA